MARRKTNLEKLETKYGRKVNALYKKMSNRPIQEFCDALQILKEQLAKEIESLPKE